MTPPNVHLEDILDALVLEESEPSYEALTRWSTRYPEYSEALEGFFSTWAVQAELPPEVEVDKERLANLAVSYALDTMHRRGEAAKPKQKAIDSNVGLRLLSAARSAGISREQLAACTSLDDMVIEKLDLRRLTGIPGICFERLAAVLGMASTLVQDMVTGPPLVATGVHYKAKGKPTPTTEDFADAIRNSSLPEEAKHLWLEAIAVEREGGKR